MVIHRRPAGSDRATGARRWDLPMTQRTTPSGLNADEVYTIAMHYLRRIEDLLGDDGDLALARNVAFASDDLSTGPWQSLNLSLDFADTLPVSTAREHLEGALRLLAEISNGATAHEALFHVRYHLAPLFRK